MSIETDWVVITGPPSSGKTTLLNLCASAGDAISRDSTRELIKRVVAEGRDAEEFRFANDFQPRVLAAMREAEEALDPATRTFLEYALPCNIAFHRTEGRPVPPELDKAAQLFRYRRVFILDPLPFERDDQRVEDAEYQTNVHRHMWDVYRELGYSPVRLPAEKPVKLEPPYPKEIAHLAAHTIDQLAASLTEEAIRTRYGTMRMILQLPA